MRLSYSLRAFGIYFIILGALIWFTLDNAVERLNDGMRQSAESVLVDMANFIAELVEAQISDPSVEPVAPSFDLIKSVFAGVAARKLDAKIYKVQKTEIDSSILITDAQGIVIYDSTGTHTGKDFSRWNDIKLTLEGAYGARTSYIDQRFTAPDDPKAMFVAAPVIHNGSIIGVVSVSKPINSLETHLVTESKQLQRYAFGLLLIALVIGYFLSLWFTYALNKIAHYANAMAAGETIDRPQFVDQRLSQLTDSVSNLRKQLDGKEYVENYIHSLTHELKTPITGIGGAVELLQEPLNEEDKQRFLSNIKTSNQRMSTLVDRMLSLAKLESFTAPIEVSEFDLVAIIERLTNERRNIANAAQVELIKPSQPRFMCRGDPILLSQAVGNLLDNAIRFSISNSQILIGIDTVALHGKDAVQVSIRNQGQQIPEYALSKVFDRFFSLPRNDAQGIQSRSTGLGLSFVREILKLHQGTVQLQNRSDGVEAIIAWPR